MSDRTRTPTEIEALLKAQGLEPGDWKKLPAQAGRPAFVNDQIALLQKLKGVLEGEQARLLTERQKAREALAKLRHGGGS